MSLGARFRKVKSFLEGHGIEGITIHPRPWANDPRFYYLVNPLHDSDGHGGYARAHRFDEDGVPFVPRGSERYYNPLVVARYALKMLAISADRERPEAAEIARKMLAPLVAAGEATGAWGPGPRPEQMSHETPSCLTQGVVLSAIIRLAGSDPDERTRAMIERGAERLLAPMEHGGARSSLSGGDFLEEFPRVPPSHVLNGCVYGLFGLYDLADGFGHAQAAEAATLIESTLERTIERFVTRFGWSRYALNVYSHAPLASIHYHRYHIVMTRVLAARTGSAALAEVADRWERSLAAFGPRLASGAIKSAQVLWMRGIRRLPLHEG